MIVVIQCAATKRPDAGFLRRRDGTPVMFVADSANAPANERYAYARPDDLSDTGASWRQALVEYNDNPGNNPLGLCRAYELYENATYQRLADRLGIGNTYILSAGWGLIGAAFLTPQYDITFSAAVKKKAAYKLRKKADHYEDLCMLPRETKEPIVFFGGKDYVALFCTLTHSVEGPRILFYNANVPPDAPGCVLQKYPTATKTNWHYECANAFLDNRIELPLPGTILATVGI